MDRHSQNPGSSHTNIASAKAAEAEARQELADWRRALEASLAEQALQGDYTYLVNRLVSAPVLIELKASLTLPQSRILSHLGQARVTGPLISDSLGPLLEAMWYEADKNAGIPKLRTAIRDWDEDQRATAEAKQKKSVPVSAAPPSLRRAKVPTPQQPAKTTQKRVEFDTGSRPSAPKGKARALSPPRSDDDDAEDEMDVRRTVAVGPPAKSRTVSGSEKRAREASEEEGEESVPGKAAPPPAKKKRIVSDKFIDDSDEGEDSEEVGGENPYPCSRCLERKMACEWLLDTGKKSCKGCACGKVRCSTMQENKDALREKRRAVQKAAKRSMGEKQEGSARPMHTAVTVKRAAPPSAPGVSKLVEKELDAKLESWNKKFQGRSNCSSRCYEY